MHISEVTSAEKKKIKIMDIYFSTLCFTCVKTNMHALYAFFHMQEISTLSQKNKYASMCIFTCVKHHQLKKINKYSCIYSSGVTRERSDQARVARARNGKFRGSTSSEKKFFLLSSSFFFFFENNNTISKFKFRSSKLINFLSFQCFN